MLIIEAKVNFRTHPGGGIDHEILSGIRPSFSVSDDLIMCEVFGNEGVSSFTPGKQYIVTIKLPYGEKYSEEIIKGYKFRLQVGGKKFADGIVV